MADPRKVVNFTDLIALFRRLDDKIESVSNDFRLHDPKMIEAAEELKNYQKRLEVIIDNLANMFVHGMKKEDDDHLEVQANTQEDLIVLKALHQWFTKKEEDLEARLDQLSALKAHLDQLLLLKAIAIADSRKEKGKGPSTSICQVSGTKTTSGKLKAVPEESQAGSSITEIEELDSTDEELPVSFEVKEDLGPGYGDLNTLLAVNRDRDTLAAAKLVRGLVDPLRRLTNRLNLSVPSDAERESIDDILARSHELGVSISRSAVILFIHLCHEKTKKEMCLFRTFMGYLKTTAEESSNREAMKWIVHVLKVAREELKQEDTTEGQEETPRTAEDNKTPATFTLVEDLTDQLTSVITQLDSLMNLDLIKEPLPIAEVVKLIDENFKNIKRAVESIKRDAEALGIRLKYGCFAPVIIRLANTCGLCFKLWSYLAKFGNRIHWSFRHLQVLSIFSMDSFLA